MSSWREIVTAYPCPVCDAAPGVHCVTVSGRAKYEPHADRSRLASRDRWINPEERASCAHCLDSPPWGHTCPHCGRTA